MQNVKHMLELWGGGIGGTIGRAAATTREHRGKERDVRFVMGVHVHLSEFGPKRKIVRRANRSGKA